MTVTGVLRNARRTSKAEDPRGPCLSGEIYSDVRGRFADGTRVTTSTIIKELEDDTFVTRNSVYKVESWQALRSTYPRVPAAFINAIAEEGTKAEAIEYLQKTWDELCAVRAGAEPANDNVGTFQKRVTGWANSCFASSIVSEKPERNHRFLEEALELVQALGTTAEEAHMLVDYVFGRPVGEPHQEMGGVMATLALLAEVNGMDAMADGEIEYERIIRPEIMAKIRSKQLAKPASSPLPGVTA